LSLAKQHRKIESQLIQVLQQVDHCKLFKKLGVPSLFIYATQILGLSESVVYAFISVARRAKELPLLQTVIDRQELSVSKASRVVSSLKLENTKELVEFAKNHTLREIDFKIAEQNPQKARNEKISPISEDQEEVRVVISKATLEKLKRAESLEAQKGKQLKLNEVIDTVLDVYLKHQDPVKKAERAQTGILKANPRNRPQSSEKQSSNLNTRQPLTAAQKHAVFKRDQGKCTHVDLSGKRCNQDRWLELHHVHPVSLGGSNEPENLVILCSHHHDLAHQLSLDIEGQVTWLRSPVMEYGFIEASAHGRRAKDFYEIRSLTSRVRQSL
jgi:5-methylcytosine-specific restriction endonuclease McrA